MAFKVLYHEDSLADLEEIFEWSREKHPETTEQFADDLFDYIDLHWHSRKGTSSNQADSPLPALHLLSSGREPGSH
jgi:hypothetical protein